MDRLTALPVTILPVPKRKLPSVVPISPGKGFTLTEMAVVLAIVTLLIGGMILPLSAQQDIRNVSETQKTLSDITDALYGFAATKTANDGKPYLPCPDTNTTPDGLENRNANGVCVDNDGTTPKQEGSLPWATLGMGRYDAWGNTLRYRVASSFSNSAAGFTLVSVGDLRVCDSSACTSILASGIPAVILSLGKNGAATPSDADELENKDGDSDFVQRPQAASASSFDDIVTWLPPSILIHRMISASKLP